jgi:hypothetical protein
MGKRKLLPGRVEEASKALAFLPWVDLGGGLCLCPFEAAVGFLALKGFSEAEAKAGIDQHIQAGRFKVPSPSKDELVLLPTDSWWAWVQDQGPKEGMIPPDMLVIGDKSVRLSPLQFRLAGFLLAHGTVTLTELMEAGWGGKIIDEVTVRSALSKLGRRLVEVGLTVETVGGNVTLSR